MRKSVVVLTILTPVTVACTTTTSSSGRPSAVDSAATPTAAESTIRGTSSVTAPASTLALTVVGSSSTSPIGAQASISPVAHATEVVRALINGTQPGDVPDASTWAAVVAGGSIIDTLQLSNAAGRAVVTVSIAFENVADEAITDPISLRIELALFGSQWRVQTVGYL
jgi:hypothetical protein